MKMRDYPEHENEIIMQMKWKWEIILHMKMVPIMQIKH